MRLNPRDASLQKRKWPPPSEITAAPISGFPSPWTASMASNSPLSETGPDSDLESYLDHIISDVLDQSVSTATTTDTATVSYGPGASRRPYPFYNSKRPITTRFPTPVEPVSSGPWNPTATNSNPVSSSPAPSSDDDDDDDGDGKPPAIFAAIGVVLIILICVAVFTFLFLRKRKKRQQAQRAQGLPVQEIAKTQDQQPLVQAAYSLAPTSSSTRPAIPSPPQVPQPAILGPITPAGAWNTGIDTSDMVSMNDAPPAANPFVNGDDENDPPPPYRPRSVALSRDVSLRAPSALGVITRRTEYHEEEARSPVSPLASPSDDDDALSFMPATAPRAGV